MPLFGNDTGLFGQDRELGERYSAEDEFRELRSQENGFRELQAMREASTVGRAAGDIFGKPIEQYDEIIDARLKSGMSNDAIEDEIRNIEGMGMLNDMREGSVTGALGNVPTEELERLAQGMMGFSPINSREQMSPERIHNLGVLYGSPLSQERVDYFENQMNRDPNQSYMGNFPKFPR